MANGAVTNCSECAYVKKENGKLWCPFHDVPVSSRLVCDEFLDEYQSPSWQSLSAGMQDGRARRKRIPQHTRIDVVAYVVTGALMLLSLLFFIFAKP